MALLQIGLYGLGMNVRGEERGPARKGGVGDNLYYIILPFVVICISLRPTITLHLCIQLHKRLPTLNKAIVGSAEAEWAGTWAMEGAPSARRSGRARRIVEACRRQLGDYDSTASGPLQRAYCML